MDRGGSVSFPLFSRTYFHTVAKAYNMTRYVVDALRLDDTVFATAMCYWHQFALQHSYRRVHPVVLAAACVFLAGKVEHYKLRVDQIVALVFEVTPDKNEEEAAGWRRMVLEVELLLSDTLQFDFQRTHPIRAAVERLSTPYGKLAAEQTDEDRRLVAETVAMVNRFYVLSLITPLYATTSADAVVWTLVYMTVHYAGTAAAYEHVWQSHSLPPETVRNAIVGVVIDAFAYMRKRTGLSALDEMIDHRRKRLRRDASGSVQSSTLMSSAGSGSVERTPTLNMEQ